MPSAKVVSSLASPRAARVEIEVDGVRLWIAFHSNEIIANGWQPYDQPEAAAYVPLGRERLHQIDCPGGILLIESEAREVRTS